uniref:Gasdermin pore forming domain-containing protein n=1 Tax=Mola mola TaxID=94237 RepID=A0A3Q3VTS5_MOLML
MLVTATRNFVEEVDHGGLLIPVSSLNDTIALLSVVVKRKRLWFWQRPKYIPTDFKLNDILTGDAPIKPAITETKFIKYNGTYGGNIQGSIDANFGPGRLQSSLNLEGKDSSKLQSSFGSLKKEEVDMQQLLQDTKHRVLDMSHDLVRQTKEKPRQSFGIVKERIVTTQPCSVIEDVQLGGECGGGLSFLRNKLFGISVSCIITNLQVLLKDNASLRKDSNVTMEIPVHTTIAYALIELEIKESGCFELCLMSYTTGGFEVDGPAQKVVVGASGAPADSIKNYQLRQELELLNKHFQLLSALPVTTRSTLLQQITEVMEDQGATPVSSTRLVALPEDVYKNIEHLFASSSMSMKRNGETVTAEINQQAGNLPLILCVAVRGLASLAHCD